MKDGKVIRKDPRKVPRAALLSYLLLILVILVIGPRCILDTHGTYDADFYSAGPPPDGCAGQDYQYDLNSYFDVSDLTPPLEYRLTNDLPPGLGLDTATGIISGRIDPSAADHSYSFSILVADSGHPEEEWPQAGFIVRVFDFAIVTPWNAPPPLCVGSPYSFEIALCGGQPPFTWTVDTWTPEDLPLSFAAASTDARQNTLVTPATFTIPAEPQNYRFWVRITDNTGEAIQREFQVSTVASLSILSPTILPDGRAGQAFSYTFAACGGTAPFTWQLTDGSVPGLALAADSGTFSGTPTSGGSFWFTVRVTDAAAAAFDQRFVLAVLSPLTVESPIRIPGVECYALSVELSTHTTGGVGAQFWELAGGTPPSGITFESDGTLSGRLTRPGIFTFTVRVYDETIDPASPLTSTVILTVAQDPPDAGLVIERVRQGHPNPANPGYLGINVLHTSLTDAARIDLTIDDAGWAVAWYRSATKEATIRVEGLCDSSLSTASINYRDVGDADGGAMEYVVRFEAADLFALIDAAGGVAGSPFRFRVILDFTDNKDNRRVGTTAEVTVQVASPPPDPGPILSFSPGEPRLDRPEGGNR